MNTFGTKIIRSSHCVDDKYVKLEKLEKPLLGILHVNEDQ